MPTTDTDLARRKLRLESNSLERRALRHARSRWPLRFENTGQLTSTGLVDPLKKPEMARRWQPDDVVVGEAGRPIAQQDVDREVLVDHQQGGDRSGAVVGVLTAEQSVRVEVGIQSRLELIGEIAPSDTAQDLASLRGDTRVTGAAASTARFKQFLTNAHEPSVPSGRGTLRAHLMNRSTPPLNDPACAAQPPLVRTRRDGLPATTARATRCR